jgi:hypothetical protein
MRWKLTKLSADISPPSLVKLGEVSSGQKIKDAKIE